MKTYVQQISEAEPDLGDALNVLLASVASFDERARTTLASNEIRGLFQSNLEKATGRDTADDRKRDRYLFTETVFGIPGGSASALTHAQSYGTTAWISKYKHMVPRIVASALRVRGQQELLLTTSERLNVARSAMAVVTTDDDPVVEAARELGASVRERSKQVGDNNDHWLSGETETAFVEYVKSTGLDKRSVFALFERGKTKAKLSPQEATHNEARVIAFCEMYVGNMRVNITAREGATPDDVLDVVVALLDATNRLDALGLTSTKKNDPAPQTTIAPPKPAQKPAPKADDGDRNNGDGDVKSGTAPLNKLTVDADGKVAFYVGKFRWPFTDARGAEVAIQAFDPDLNWTVGHLAPGSKYDGDAVAGLVVDWVKPGQYYDVVRVYRA
jgi:hypothetical protein